MTSNSGIAAKYFINVSAVVMFVFSLSFSAFSQEETPSVEIRKWLHLGNFKVMPPAYGHQNNLNGKTYQSSDLLHYNFIAHELLAPRENAMVNWKDTQLKWEILKTSKSGDVLIEKQSNDSDYQLAYLAAFLQNNRWMKSNLEITCPQMFTIFLDGKKIKSKESNNKKDDAPEKISVELTLEKGKHLLLIKTLKSPKSNPEWKLSAILKTDSIFRSENLTTTIEPDESMTIHHLLNGDFVNSATVSPDGDLVLLKFSTISSPDGDKSSWAEVRNIANGKIIQSFRETKAYGMKWLPSGAAISYETSNEKNENSLWIFDFATMNIKNILNNVKDFGSYTWSPDATFLIYSVSEETDEKDKDLKLFEGMPDRWPWWRNRSFLYKLDVASGVHEQLTYGHLTTSLMDIRSDGQKILFSQSVPDFSQRPYSKQFLMEMDIESYAIDTVWKKNFDGNCQYSADGLHMLVTGSPALFGNIGTNVTGDVVPNDYDTQAYIYDMASGDVVPITFNFNPSIQQVVWSKYDENKIYFLAEDRTYRQIFVYDLNTQYFEKLNTGFDVVTNISLANKVPLGVFTGSRISTPEFAVSIDLNAGNIKTIANPRAETFENVKFGETAEWNFTNKNGVEIEGRIYFPPDFDKNKKYPLIVYYYAGTSPTERNFGGRYPKNIFAAQGYVVYNLQPSGATGYGQDFSAAHVNNWGITVADEIIDGTKQFLEGHDYIDPRKVGCLGASYGGFMTMLLQTRTNIFAAAISHAGISSIASYWGEGYWGYLYSSVASANSFPWNNKKMYVEQSALFNADKINTPLLLLYGTNDTNVPPGESIQLYTALKLLGKPVELIEIKGQDHHIVNYKKRIEWQNTIFAWFDKWLKDQPEWWNELYPDRNL